MRNTIYVRIFNDVLIIKINSAPKVRKTIYVWNVYYGLIMIMIAPTTAAKLCLES